MGFFYFLFANSKKSYEYDGMSYAVSI